jgi:hypothetical protein
MACSGKIKHGVVGEKGDCKALKQLQFQLKWTLSIHKLFDLLIPSALHIQPGKF